MFASDAEALAAAEKAYAAYLKVSDEVAQGGGHDADRLIGLAAGNLLTDDRSGFQTFVAKGWRSVGSTKLTNIELQSADLKAGPGTPAAVVTYLCEDVSGVDVLDASGASVVSPQRPNEQQFQVTFDLSASKLIPSEREPWAASGICK